MLTQVEQRKATKEFAKRWEGMGYEKGHSATFWLELLHEVYGIERPGDFIRFEEQVKMDHTSYIDGYIPTTHVLIEQKSMNKDLTKPIKQSDGSLLSPFQQAKRYSAELAYSERPRWIVTSNFREFFIYDMEKPSGEPEVVLLSELENDYYRMFFLVNEEDEDIQKQKQVSLKAGELVGVLYDALLREYQNPEDEQTLKDLNVLCVRLVFCFYAEDAGLFGSHGNFHDYLMKYKDLNFRDALIKLFKILDQRPEERDPYIEDDLAVFPYVNGELFADKEVVIPRINEEIIDIILNQASANFDWSNISPTIFGGVFESTLNPETRRSGGMHYTAIKNIHKVIDPLFMNNLNEEFDEIKSIKVERTRNRRLKKFQEKLASLKFLDPAAGSGNFLTETYLSLRRLENKVIKLSYGGQIVMGETFNPIKVSISQFYGIEINDFAVTVARTALWIAESQMFQETQDIIHSNIDFLPLKSYANIIEANALQLDWNEVIPKNELDYIMGNPPFIGARLMDDEQKSDVYNVFGKEWKNIGNLDYVSCWFKKASDFVDAAKVECALVATNSISQGDSVATLWEPLFMDGLTINFAHQSFKWFSEASQMAQVHVVIVGFAKFERKEKVIYTSENKFSKSNNINAYLLDASNVFIASRTKPLENVPEIGIGNQPIDGGNYLFTKEEMEEFIQSEPNSKKYFKPWYGAVEFINRKPRYCLWVGDATPHELRKMPLVMERIKNVREYRLKSKRKATKRLADRPTRFCVENIPDTNFLVIPSVTSEKRKYIPIGFMLKYNMSSNRNLIMAIASLYELGILVSNVHMGWMRVVTGRLEMRYNYSKNIVYNNFPWPRPNKIQKEIIKKTASEILKSRDKYKESTLADLYNELTMPPQLRKAHQENDKAVMEAYGFDWRNMTESECVAELMKMYDELIRKK